MARSDEMQTLMDRLAVLEAEKEERTDSTDPNVSLLTNLQEHLATRKAMLPQHDLTDLIDRAGSLDAKSLNADDTGAFNYAMSRYLAKNGPVAHEFSLIADLGEQLHQAALDKKAEAAVKTPVVKAKKAAKPSVDDDEKAKQAEDDDENPDDED